jgi:ATP-dependent Clp protease, protease subunit
MRPCYAFKAAAADKPATLSIFDEIGFWGVQAKDFIKDLKATEGKVLNVEINSPGGDVFAGLSIYNALKMSGKEIVVTVMGVAASAASLIAMAGDKIVMPKNTFMMIHNPWSFAMGNADELREQADTLDKIGSSLLQTYVARTGLPEDEVAAMLAKDTWLTADEALEMGFATEVADEVKANASFDMARADLPEFVRAVYAAASAEPGTEPEAPEADPVVEVDPVVAPQAAAEPAESPVAEQVVALAVAAGLEAFAPHLALACADIAAAKARIGEVREIVALCVAAKKPEDAAKFVSENKTLSDVRNALITSMAQADEHISTARDEEKQAAASNAKPNGPTTQSLWASHNRNK